MSANYKVLGQINPVGLTTSTLYMVPSRTQTVVSTLSVCNTGISTTYRVAVCVGNSNIVKSSYIIYDSLLESNDSVFLTLGITLSSLDSVKVYTGSSDLSFGLFGSEIN